VHVPALPPDQSFDLTVTPPKTREDLTATSETAWQPHSGHIRLQPGFAVRGVVFDAAGHPVSGVAVHAAAREADDPFVYSAYTATTDAEGRFVLPQLPKKEMMVWAGDLAGDPDEIRGAIFAPRRASEVVHMRPGDPEVTLRYRPRPKVRVRILDPEGHPVSEASIAVDQEEWSSYQSYRTDAEGWMEVETPDNDQPFSLTVVDASSPTGHLLRAVAPAWQVCEKGTREVTLRLETGLSLRGRVVDAAGKPIVGAMVEAQPTKPPPSLDDLVVCYFDPHATTGADGHFEIQGLLPGPWKIRVTTKSQRTVETQAESGEEVQITLP